MAGIGLAAHDCFSGAGWVYEGFVPSDLLEHWKAEVGEQLICEIELFAILASMLELTSILQSRRIVWWVDNDAARSVLIKGASKSWAMHSLARIFTEIDREFPINVVGVPSAFLLKPGGCAIERSRKRVCGDGGSIQSASLQSAWKAELENPLLQVSFFEYLEKIELYCSKENHNLGIF